MTSEKVKTQQQDGNIEKSNNSTNLVGDLSDNDHFKEKILFTIFAMDTIMSPVLVILVPQFYFVLHTIKAFILLPYRYRYYFQRNRHYLFADFCYYTHFLLLAYLWLIPSGKNAGCLFIAMFCYCNGPLLWGIVMWKNPLVFHSMDKMTSIYMHLSPVLVVNSIRWNSIQGYTTCPVELTGNDICNLNFIEFFTYPVVGYGIWQVIYYVWVEIIRREIIKKNKFITSYYLLLEHFPKGPSYYMVHSCGPQWCKTIYYTLHAGYYFLFMVPCYLLYYSLEINAVVIMAFISVACWYGAQNTFSKRYRMQQERLRTAIDVNLL
ncbi:uncharacterized protein [Dysidea avara]|uniref:uncharacterized protein n=1 Tax=Dysidea avara TaxID=196820 RepID=UPI00332BB29A